MEQRQNVQERISKRKGNSSRDSFKVGDRVRIKSNTDGRWVTKGVIQEARPSGSSSPPASFVVLSDSGTEFIRHKSYLKHDATNLDVDFGGLASGFSAGVDSPSSADRPVSVSTQSLGDTGTPGLDSTHPVREPDPVDRVWEGRLRPRAESKD